MNRFSFFVGAVSLAAVVLMGCESVPKKPATVVYKYENNGSPVEITVLNTTAKSKEPSSCTVTLCANPTTGYSWSYRLTPDKVIKVTDEKYVQDKKDERTVGAGGKQYYIFTPQKQGIADAILTYTRPWEKTKSDQKIRIKFSIDKNRDIYVQDVILGTDK